MIKISLIENELQEYHPCLSCGKKENVREVGFGVIEIKNYISLCSDCINEMKDKSNAMNSNFIETDNISEHLGHKDGIGTAKKNL